MIKRGLVTLVGVVVVFGSIYFLVQDSYYSKQTRGQILLRTILYSTENQIAAVQRNFLKEKEFVLDVPFFKQNYPVTCEVASLRMVLHYRGHSMTEDELLTHLSFDTTDPISPDGIWGDPEKGFVGDINGSVFEGTGYGVHEGPIKDLAKVYGNVVELQEPDLLKIIGLLDGGRPIIVWGLLSSRNTISWRTAEGRKVEVYPGEHVRVVIGYTGEAHDPDKIILLDPIYGQIRMSAEEFVADWEMMNNRIVVVK